MARPPLSVDSMVGSSPCTSSSSPELRRRSLAPYLSEFQQKEVTTMVQEQEIERPPSYGTPTSQPSFMKRYFYRSPKNGKNDGQDPPTPRFSWSSRGSVISIILLLLLIILVVLSAVLATVFRHKKHASTRQPSPVRQVIFANFADPAIVQHDDGTWYAFATNNAAGVLDQSSNSSMPGHGGSNVQLATSQDFVDWTLHNSTQDPLPVLGAWVKPPLMQNNTFVSRANVWAPEILRRPSDGKYVMFYSAATKDAPRSHCVGAAVSDDGPAGPYTPFDTPITCPITQGGTIDAAAFIDEDGTIWVAWKIDGNNVGHGGSCGNTVPPLVGTPIILQKMQADGYTPDGPPVTILDRIASDGPLVEAPSIVRSDKGIYFLFFSSGCTRDPSYDLKYAWATNVTGPYTRADSPLLKTGDWGLLAPGSIGLRKSEDGSVKMAFHARVQTDSGRVRAMFTSKMTLHGKTVTLVQ